MKSACRLGTTATGLNAFTTTVYDMVQTKHAAPLLSELITAKILVADDDLAFCETTSALLLEAGYDVEMVSDAQSAISRLAEKSFDLLITDIRMPGSEDLDYLKILATRPELVPIIVITGYPSVETAAKSLRLPVMSYLFKPLDIEPFLDEVRRVLGMRRIQSIVDGVLEQTRVLGQHLGSVKEMFVTNPREATSAPATLHLLQLLFGEVRSAVGALEQYFIVANQCGAVTPNPNALFRPLALVEVLQETVIVLGKSKDTFKSKELADLRRKIERLILVAGVGDTRSSTANKETS